MHLFLHRIEKAVDFLTGPLLILLAFALAADIIYAHRYHEISVFVEYVDYTVIFVFAVDLAFKFSRVRRIPLFVRRYWLEIIATIPFFLIFRVTELLGIQEFIERGQAVAHEVPELTRLEREGSAIVREAGKAGRTARLIRTFRVLSRFPRFLRALPFYEKPTGRHHPHELKRRSNKFK